jgi:hypothetical protein
MVGYLHETEIAEELECTVRTVRALPFARIVLNREHWFPEKEFRDGLRKRTRTPKV